MTWLWPLLAAPFAGSFLGVVIRRLPEGRYFARARSACESCGQDLAPRDLVPLMSWVVLRGRCRFCGGPIAGFYPAVELAALIVAASAVLADPQDAARIWIGCLLGWALLALGWIDWEHYRLPDVLTLPMIVAGLGVTWLWYPFLIADHALAAVIGYASLWALNEAYYRLRGQDGIGAGDAKLLAACGAWVGLAALPLVLIVASVTGLLIAALRGAGGEAVSRTMRLPFGTCLALALWIAWLAPNL